MHRKPILQRYFVLTGIGILLSAPVFADEPVESEPVINAETSSNPENKLVNEFGEFLGGEEQSRNVIQSLRDGSYGQTPAEDGTPTETSSTGWGNVRITLKLAEARLTADGITQPTAEQLDAVLLGTDSDPNGILALRESGMGWGEISQQYGYKLGTVMGNGKSPDYIPSSTPSAASNAAQINVAGSNHGQAKKGGYIPSGGQTLGQGVTTAAGDTAVSVSAKNTGNAYGHNKVSTAGSASAGKGIVSASGGAGHAASAASNAGKSNGKALGHTK